jgi:hypothetical protein
MSVVVDTGTGQETYDTGMNLAVEEGHLVVEAAGDDAPVIAVHAPGHWRSARVVPAPAKN